MHHSTPSLAPRDPASALPRRGPGRQQATEPVISVFTKNAYAICDDNESTTPPEGLPRIRRPENSWSSDGRRRIYTAREVPLPRHGSNIPEEAKARPGTVGFLPNPPHPHRAPRNAFHLTHPARSGHPVLRPSSLPPVLGSRATIPQSPHCVALRSLTHHPDFPETSPHGRGWPYDRPLAMDAPIHLPGPFPFRFQGLDGLHAPATRP